MMKRFLVFRYEQYYPCGGWSDFHSAHDDLESAKRTAAELKKRSGNVEVVDLHTLEEIE